MMVFIAGLWGVVFTVGMIVYACLAILGWLGYFRRGPRR